MEYIRKFVITFSTHCYSFRNCPSFWQLALYLLKDLINSDSRNTNKAFSFYQVRTFVINEPSTVFTVTIAAFFMRFKYYLQQSLFVRRERRQLGPRRSLVWLRSFGFGRH